MIGLIDSGIGGLSTYHSLTRHYPTADILYLADQAHLPYGNKSPKALLAYLENALDWMAVQNADIVLVACGTLSSAALPHLRKIYPFPIYDIVSVGAKEAALYTKTHQAILLATEATIRSGFFEKALQKAGFDKVYTQACPQFVRLVEQGICKPTHPHLKDALKTYISGYVNASADVVLLGCTHYHFLLQTIGAYLPCCRIIDCGVVLANSCPPPTIFGGVHRFFTTGHLPTFAKQLKQHLSTPPQYVAKATLPSL